MIFPSPVQSQYTMLLDIVNNLLLYKEPRQKELTETMKRLRFTLQLNNIEDCRTPILARQERVRSVVGGSCSVKRQCGGIDSAVFLLFVGSYWETSEHWKKISPWPSKPLTGKEGLAGCAELRVWCSPQTCCNVRAVPAALLRQWMSCTITCQSSRHSCTKSGKSWTC